jgi:hypothetical protein
MKNPLVIIFLSLMMGTFLICLGGSFVGAVWYTQPTPAAEVQTEYVDREIIVTKEVERIVTQIVEVEKIVTQAPIQMEAPIAMPTFTPTAEPIQIICTNVAWVVSQPISNLQGDALKIGTLKRLRFRIRNMGTCIWREGYVLTSSGVFPDLPVPYTEPGQEAYIEYTFKVYKSLEARFVLQPGTPSGIFGVLNSPSPGVGEEAMYYRLDVYKGKTIIQIPEVLGGGTIECVGPN